MTTISPWGVMLIHANFQAEGWAPSLPKVEPIGGMGLGRGASCSDASSINYYTYPGAETCCDVVQFMHLQYTVCDTKPNRDISDRDDPSCRSSSLLALLKLRPPQTPRPYSVTNTQNPFYRQHPFTPKKLPPEIPFSYI
ncbi:hypothetical protein PGTUg99_010169 [Puccinia graminis f. sp. tritici]|uniref:Uncharacterized protein n=1 Tax=Puccinia graminis f. sp. tritici TaxID=56615 RepID=A0A5B0MSE2_PUCGR|nr:hypothetical protein PGTUg99_010169 [Puccinia graminis f. sp. tritici]